MCGICGLFGKTANRELAEQMSLALCHRGPDASGYYETVTSADSTVILASRRLAITDTEHGAQPMSEDFIHLVWNGEIYNHESLRSLLEGEGYTFRSDHSDTEVLLKAYKAYGEQFVEKLLGMYAIVIYDARKETLFVWRDGLGVKPFFYVDNAEQFAFASEIKGLFAHPLVHRKPLSEAGKSICDYMQYRGAVAPDTMYAHVKELPPGCCLVVSDGDIVMKRYRALSYADSPVGTDLDALMYAQTFDSCDAVTELRSLIRKAVDLRMRADCGVDILLSGGLDSAYLTALAAELMYEPVHTHTLGFVCEAGDTHGKQSDVEAAEYVARRLGTFHTTYHINGKEALESLDELVRIFDQPYAGGVSLYWLLCRVPENRRVFLTGDGADEAFWGYPYHKEAYRFLHGKEKNALLDTARYKDPGEPVELFEMLLAEEFKEQLQKSAADSRDSGYAPTSPKERVAAHINKTYYERLLPGQVLRYGDTLSMALGKELRMPYLDERIVRYANALPVFMKMGDGKTKHLLKQVASNLLPDTLIRRKKETFLPPIYLWLQREWKECVTDVLSFDRLAGQRVFAAENVQFLLKCFYDNPEKNMRTAELIWSVFMFQKWLDRED